MSMLEEMDRTRFMKAFRPKVMGAWNLHVNTQDQPLDFLVNFSSISGQYGNPAQGNYAAANTFLDMFAPIHFHRWKPGPSGQDYLLDRPLSREGGHMGLRLRSLPGG